MTELVLDSSPNILLLGPFVSEDLAQNSLMEIQQSAMYNSRLSFKKLGEQYMQEAIFTEQQFTEHPELESAEGLAIVKSPLLPLHLRDPDHHFNEKYDLAYNVLFRFNALTLTRQGEIDFVIFKMKATHSKFKFYCFTMSKLVKEEEESKKKAKSEDGGENKEKDDVQANQEEGQCLKRKLTQMMLEWDFD